MSCDLLSGGNEASSRRRAVRPRNIAEATADAAVLSLKPATRTWSPAPYKHSSILTRSSHLDNHVGGSDSIATSVEVVCRETVALRTEHALPLLLRVAKPATGSDVTLTDYRPDKKLTTQHQTWLQPPCVKFQSDVKA